MTSPESEAFQESPAETGAEAAPLTEAELAELAKMYKVETPDDAVTALSETLAKDKNVLSVLQKIKSAIAINGSPEVGSPDFNDIVESLRAAGHDDPESLTRRILDGDTDHTIEAGYKSQIAYSEELISKHQKQTS